MKESNRQKENSKKKAGKDIGEVENGEEYRRKGNNGMTEEED